MFCKVTKQLINGPTSWGKITLTPYTTFYNLLIVIEGDIKAKFDYSGTTIEVIGPHNTSCLGGM